MARNILLPHLTAAEILKLMTLKPFRYQFHLEDYFCLKHGCTYDDVDIDDEKMSSIVREVERDGKDPKLFQFKLMLRTTAFPVEKSEDEDFNFEEVPLSEDPEYGTYFKRLQECNECESEALARSKAKEGLILCEPCSTYYHFREGKHDFVIQFSPRHLHTC